MGVTADQLYPGVVLRVTLVGGSELFGVMVRKRITYKLNPNHTNYYGNFVWAINRDLAEEMGLLFLKNPTKIGNVMGLDGVSYMMSNCAVVGAISTIDEDEVWE